MASTTLARAAGRGARFLGLSIFSNPYPVLRCIDTEWSRRCEAKRQAWSDGWMDEDTDIALHRTSKDEAHG